MAANLGKGFLHFAAALKVKIKMSLENRPLEGFIQNWKKGVLSCLPKSTRKLWRQFCYNRKEQRTNFQYLTLNLKKYDGI